MTVTFSTADQKKHRVAFVTECRQKAWGALCNADYIGKELDKLVAAYEKLRAEDAALGKELEAAEGLPDAHTYDNRMKRKGIQERREAIKQQSDALAANMRQGQEAMTQLQASAENNLALARFADDWELKEVEVKPSRKEKLEIEVVEAPGDLCGNTKKLADGSPCPGCRACQ